MKTAEWFEKNKVKYTSFRSITKLVKLKKSQKQTISVVIPTYNEEKTIGKIIRIIRETLMDKFPLVDELIVIDSGSPDDTLEIAKKLGATAYLASDILRRYGDHKGKGENLWKSLYVSNGSIICWVDADIKNFHPRFIYGLVGPLLTNPKIGYTKPFYSRPIKIGDKLEPLGGGRVTEILIRPLFNQYFPRLAGFIQPLSGEGAARREILERIPYYTGYGVETAMLIDISRKFGLRSIMQVDLKKRIHRNQPLWKLSNMAFAILQVFMQRADMFGKMVQVGEMRNIYNIITMDSQKVHKLKRKRIEDKQRFPIISLREYRQKFHKEPSWIYL